MNNRKPNIIFIIMDSARQDMFGCYGSNENLTPNLDLFARRGLLLRNFYAAGCGSAQAHVSAFTGQHSSRHKMVHNFCELDNDLITMSLLLKRLGYKAFGHTKFSIVPPSGYGELFGFEELIDPGTRIGETKTAFTKTKIKQLFKSDTILRRFLKGVYDKYTSKDMRLRNAADTVDGKSSLDYLFNKIKENKDKSPVFAYTTLLHPHTPYYPPRRFLDKVFKGKKINSVAHDIQLNVYRYVNGDFGEARDAIEDVRKCYKANLLYADYLIGEFVDKLEAESLMENTICIFMADHGELLGEDGLLSHGSSVREELFNIPGIIYSPEKIEHGLAINHLTSVLDIFPSIFDLIGQEEWARKQTALDGISVFDSEYDWKNRFLIVDSPPLPLPERLKKYPNILKNAHVFSRAIRTLSYKYIWQSNGDNYLFSTEDKESSGSNLLHHKEELVNKLHKDMIGFYTSINPGFKIDEYPLSLSKSTTEKMTDPSVRDELIKLGYLER